mgnify:CR=1 FL=1
MKDKIIVLERRLFGTPIYLKGFSFVNGFTYKETYKKSLAILVSDETAVKLLSALYSEGRHKHVVAEYAVISDRISIKDGAK